MDDSTVLQYLERLNEQTRKSLDQILQIRSIYNFITYTRNQLCRQQNVFE